MRRGPRSSSRNEAAPRRSRAPDDGSSRSRRLRGSAGCTSTSRTIRTRHRQLLRPDSGIRYHGDVSAADAALQPLLAPILSAGRDGRTLVVLTSDHGESLGEHGEATHGVFAYEAALKVPLIVYQPRLVPAAVIDAPAQHIDLLPTILDAIALESPSGACRKKSAAGDDRLARDHGCADLLRGSVGIADQRLGAARRGRRGLDEVHRAADSRVVRPERRSGRAQESRVVRTRAGRGATFSAAAAARPARRRRG